MDPYGYLELLRRIGDESVQVGNIRELPDPDVVTVAVVDGIANYEGQLRTTDSSSVLAKLLGKQVEEGKKLVQRINEAQRKTYAVELMGRICAHKYADWRNAPALKWSQFQCHAAARSLCESCKLEFGSAKNHGRTTLAARKAAINATNNASANETEDNTPVDLAGQICISHCHAHWACTAKAPSQFLQHGAVYMPLATCLTVLCNAC